MNKVIFWDFDGTLVKSNQSFLSSLLRAVADAQVQVPEEACSRFLKTACSWYFPEVTYEGRTGELWWQDLLFKLEKFLTGCSVPVDKIPRISAGFRQYAVSYPYEAYEDAVSVLRAAQALGFHNYILSNNFPELNSSVCRCGFSPYVQEVLLSSLLGAEKPHGHIFSAARKLAGNPSLAVMVGDNPAADIAGARAAGLLTVLVHKEGPCPEADCIFPALSGILPFLRSL